MWVTPCDGSTTASERRPTHGGLRAMPDDRGGTAVLDASPNGASHPDARARFLRIDEPPFERDELVSKARSRVQKEFDVTRSPGGGAGGNGGDGAVGAVDRARQEANARDLEAKEAATAER